MKILIVGNGAREHAIAERIAGDAELYAVMSKKNPAIAKLCRRYWLCNIENASEVGRMIGGEKFDVGFSSPDATLAAGVSDVLEEQGMAVASPSRDASRIEWDKSYARNLMKRNAVPGLPEFTVAETEDEAKRFITDVGEVAVKPVGLTGGKGVKIMGEHLDSETAVHYAAELIKKDGSVVLEERLIGEEFTFQAFCDGAHMAFMPPVQDHKRAFEDDCGPNTGGMGSYSTGEILPFLQKSDMESAADIMRKTVAAMKKEGNPYKGVLYGQFMATKAGVKVIEFNARFGDPEAMNVVPLMKDSFSAVLRRIADGKIGTVKFENKCTVVKYLVPEGYPDNPKKDAEVSVDEGAIMKAGAKAYYASVYETDGKIYTTSSRALGILGMADDIETAEQIAENACSAVGGPVWHRKDIGTRHLIERRVKHMKELR
ncbi:phosphoribosylamine--glycine ligase, partial [Candidatus Micrarchaeota archaeon]|nr:phosphoribosylamine--glycine ligase [Candidatus Micrarchaeota archaeon]